MDKRILLIIALFITGSLGFFLYRKIYYKPDGIRYEIRPRAGLIHTSDSITYADQTKGATRWKWDFGDGEFSAEQNGAHIYVQAGKYNVKLSVYGPFGMLHDAATTINVLAGEPAVASPSIIGPERPKAGQAVMYQSATTAAAYEWKVEGDPAQAAHPQKTDKASYTFSKPGLRTLVLTLHNPDHIVRRDITVDATEPATVAAPPPAPVPHHTAAAAPSKPAKPHPQQQHQKANGLDDLGNGVEIKK